MPKKNVITIDLDKWTTQRKLAEMRDDIKENTLIQQIRRAKKGEYKASVEYWEIPELGITLVKKA